MAGDVLGHGRIVVEVEEDVARAMRRAEADFERAMRKMDGKKADLELDANIKPLQKKVADAEAKVKKYAQMRAEATADLDIKKAQRNLRRWEAELKKRREARDSVKLDDKKARRALKELQRIEEEQAKASERLARKREDGDVRIARAKAARDRAVADNEIKEQQRVADAIAKQAKQTADRARKEHAARLKERYDMSKAEHDAYVMDQKWMLARWKAQQRANAELIRFNEIQRQRADRARRDEIKNIDSVQRAQENYVRAQRELSRLERTKKPFSRPAKQDLEVRTELARAQVQKFREEIEHMGAVPIKAEIDNKYLGRARRLLDTIQNLGSASVRIGPLTTSLAGLMKALIPIGPILVGLVGSLSALAGVTGAGLVGALTVAGGAATGFGLAMIGIVGVMKPAISQVKGIMKASKAYNDQVTKTGSNSDKAKKKLEELNTTMGHLGKNAKEGFIAAGAMSDRWKNFTSPSRARFFDVMGKGIKYANDNMKWFASNTNDTFRVLDNVATGWLKALDSSEGRRTLNGIFDNFNRQLPHVLNGVGNLGAILGKTFKVASGESNGLARSFENWTKKMNEGFDGSKVKSLINDAKTLGRFMKQLTATTLTFFGAGRKSGGKMLDDMTNALKRWQDAMNSDGGSGIQKFFRDSVANTQALYAALKPIAGQFITWSTNMLPVVTSFLSGAAAVGSFVAGVLRGVEALGKLFGLHNSMSTFVATLGLIWAVGRIATFAAAIMRVVAVLRTLIATLGVLRAAMVAAIATRSIGAGLATASAGFAALRASMAGAGAGAGAGAAGLATLNPLLIAGAAAAVGAAYGFNKLQGASNHWRDEANKMADQAITSSKAIDGMNGQLPQRASELASSYSSLRSAADAMRDSEKSVADAQSRVNALRRAGKTDTDAYKAATEGLKDAESALRDQQLSYYSQRDSAQRQQNDLIDTASKRVRDQTTNLEKLRQAADKLKKYETDDSPGRRALGNRTWGDDFKKMEEQARKTGRNVRDILQEYIDGDHKKTSFLGGYGDERMLKSAKDMAKILDGQALAERNIRNAKNDQLLASLNIARAQERLPAIGTESARAARAAADAFGEVQRRARGVTGKKITNTIATKYDDPQKAAKVGAQAAAALRRGARGGSVLSIVANTKNVDMAIARLKSADLGVKVLRMVEKGGDGVAAKLRRLTGIKIPAKDVKTFEKGGKQALDMLNRIRGRNIPTKDARVRPDDGGARSMLDSIFGKLDSLDGKTARTYVKNTTENVTINRVKKFFGDDGAASGRGPSSGYKTTLVGEGGAHEWRVNNKSGEVERLGGPQFRQLTPNDYIIPTEPKYRARGRKLLSMVAEDLNIPAYASGVAGARPKIGKGTPKHKRDKKQAGSSKGVKTLSVPQQMKLGGADIEPLKDAYTKADSAYNSRTRSLDSKRKAVRTAEANYREAQRDLKTAKNAKEKKKATAAVKKAKKSLEKQRDSYDLLYYGDKGAQGDKGYSFKDLATQRSNAKRRYDAVRKVNEDIEKAQSEANRQASIMETESIKYANGDNSALKRYNDAKAARQSQLNTIAGLFKQVADAATKGSVFKREAMEKQAAAEAEATSNQYTAAPEQPQQQSLTLEDLIRVSGLGPALSQAQMGVALAKLNSPRVEDDPATQVNERAESLKDDLTAAQGVQKFYEDFYNAIKDRSDITTEAKTEAISAILGARDEVASVAADIKGDTGATSETPASQSLARDTERYNAMKAYGSNSFSAEGLAAAGVAMGGSSGGFSGRQLTAPSLGGGGNMSGVQNTSQPTTVNKSVTVNNTFAAPPADPLTWSRGVEFETGAIV